MSLFLGIVTLIVALFAAFGGRSWDYVVVVLVVDVIALLGLYGLIGLYMPFMHRLGKRWGEKRRRKGRQGFLDRPVGEGRLRDFTPRTKSR